MKIALGQMEVIPGQPAINFQHMQTMIDDAINQQADLIVFPELCLSGYLLQDKWLDEQWVKEIASYNDKILALSNKIAIIWGNIRVIENLTGRDGRIAKSNSAFFADQGKYVKRFNNLSDGWYVKHLNPDYRMFNDSRYFLSALELYQHSTYHTHEFLSPFKWQHNGKIYKVGLEVCEDMFSNDYSIDITAEYINQDVDMIVNVSASPYTKGKEKARLKHLINNRFAGIFVYCNAVSCQNNGKNVIVFDGNSMVIEQQTIKYQTIDNFAAQCITCPVAFEPLSTTSKLYQLLIYALKSFDQQLFQGRTNWIIGLSGGLDSSISAALLTKAFGAQRIRGYYLRSQYSSTTTLHNAQQVASQLGFSLQVIDIEPLVQASLNTMQINGYHEIPVLVQENIQARIRGHLLNTFAALEQGVVINNGNKVENALGYATLYGDAIGAIAPLGDLLKIELFDLAHEINKEYHLPIIPTNLLPIMDNGGLRFEFAPSAELKANQQDPMKWYYHDWLIDYLQTYPNYRIEELLTNYLDGSIYTQPIGKWIKHYQLDQPQMFIDDLNWVLRLMGNSVFKRIQSPPNILYSRGAFGNDFLESQGSFKLTDQTIELMDKIKAMVRIP
jgi:NAD+ synthase (glutamine-hydrolysing)